LKPAPAWPRLAAAGVAIGVNPARKAEHERGGLSKALFPPSKQPTLFSSAKRDTHFNQGFFPSLSLSIEREWIHPFLPHFSLAIINQLTCEKEGLDDACQVRADKVPWERYIKPFSATERGTNSGYKQCCKEKRAKRREERENFPFPLDVLKLFQSPLSLSYPLCVFLLLSLGRMQRKISTGSPCPSFTLGQMLSKSAFYAKRKGSLFLDDFVIFSSILWTAINQGESQEGERGYR